MNINTKIKIIIGVLLVVLLVGFYVIATRPSDKASQIVQIPEADPIDVGLDFYSEWLVLMASSSNAYESELFMSGILAASLRDQIIQTIATDANTDPVTCQTNVVPDSVRSRIYPVSEIETKMLIELRINKEPLPVMSFITLTAVDGQWQITTIECTAGDVAPEVEFNYDHEGFLLKSVPPPYETGKWHLVFEQDGQMGYVTPLFFSTTTMCVSQTGAEIVCNPDTFTEASLVIIKGSMTELGAEVSKVEFQ